MDEMWDKLHENDDNIEILSDCESDMSYDFEVNLEDQNDGKSIDILSFVIDQLKPGGRALDADMSDLPEMGLSDVKLPEVPKISREADMEMDIIQKILESDQDIEDRESLYIVI